MPKHSRIFRRFLISYIVILIIPNIAGYMSYRTAVAVTQSASIENSIVQLEKSQEILERRMAEVQGFTRQLAINQDLSVLMNESVAPNSANVYGIWSMIKFIKTFNQTNDFLKHFYVYIKNYNIVITPASSYYIPEHYYQMFHYNNLSFSEWKQTILERTHRSEIMPLQPFISNGSQTSAISYMQSLPLDSFNDSSPAVVVVIIDQKTIGRYLSGITDRYSGWAHISDADGQTISVLGIEKSEIDQITMDANLDKEKTSQFYKDDLVITIRSDVNGWVYRAGIPRHVLMENANKIKYITLTVTGAALLLGLSIGLMLSYRNSAPINRMLGVMKEQFGKDGSSGRNVYDFLHGNISTMITNNKRLENALNRQLPLVRDAFLKRLIAGEFQSQEEIVAAITQADIDINGNTGYAGILLIHGYSDIDSVEVLQELNAARLILKQDLLDLGDSVHLTDLGADRIVMIFTTGLEVADEDNGRVGIRIILEKLAESVFKEYRITITAAMGDPFTSFLEVSHSYEQAKQTLEHGVYMNNRGILWYNDTRTESATYYYPLDMELRLISTVRAGEIDEAKRIMLSIMKENMNNRELSMEMKLQLIEEMKGTFLKLLDQKTFMESDLFESIRNRVIDIQAIESIKSIQSEINAIMEALCGLIIHKKNESHVRAVEQIKDFITENYADAELTLYRIAEHLERPEKSISHIFKEVTGTNLFDHLEKVRMAHAEVLLASNEFTVDEIASRVGYNSSHSFRRAFKRVIGTSPSSYRQSINN